jgi:hypothetical protein
MSDIQQYLLEYDRSKKDASAVAVASATRLQNGELKLLALVESLGEHFNSENGAVRSKSTCHGRVVIRGSSANDDISHVVPRRGAGLDRPKSAVAAAEYVALTRLNELEHDAEMRWQETCCVTSSSRAPRMATGLVPAQGL